MAVTGPFSISGVSETPSRRTIFTCHPSTPSAAGRLRARDRDAAGHPGIPPAGHRARFSGLDVALSRGRRRRRLRGGRPPGHRGHPGQPALRVPLRRAAGAARAGQSYAISDIDLASRLSFFLWATAPDEALRTLAAAGRAVAAGRARAAGDAHAGRPAGRGARHSFRAPSGCACRTSTSSTPTCATTPTSTSSSRTRCGARPSSSSRHRPRRPAGPRSLHRRLHVRQRAPRPALSDPGRRRQPVPEGDVSRRSAARPARSRQRADAHLARRSHLAGAARQMGDGSDARNAAAGSAAQCARPGCHAGSRGWAPAHGARAHGAASREPGLQLVSPDDRSDRALRSTTST